MGCSRFDEFSEYRFLFSCTRKFLRDVACVSIQDADWLKAEAHGHRPACRFVDQDHRNAQLQSKSKSLRLPSVESPHEVLDPLVIVGCSHADKPELMDIDERQSGRRVSEFLVDRGWEEHHSKKALQKIDTAQMGQSADRRRVTDYDGQPQTPSRSRASRSASRPSTVGRYRAMCRARSSCSNTTRESRARRAPDQSVSLPASNSRQAISTSASPSLNPASDNVSFKCSDVARGDRNAMIGGRDAARDDGVTQPRPKVPT